MPVCPSCGRDNPEGFRFCGFCRASLAQAASAAGEERKVVTVLFCDLVGFTASSDRADPEDVRARIDPYFARLRAAAEAYGGVVDKYIGDAVMAVFGAPTSHEDDPERAVRAALRILDEISDLNKADPAMDLKVRIGVNTGEVLVRLGTPDETRGMVTGDVVNTASRLQGEAPAGGVVVGEGTYLSTKRAFDYVAMEPVELKGKAERVRLWEVRAARRSLGVETERSSTPFVGREDDLATLKQAYRRTFRESSVQLVTIVGEPGVGKSRLVAEFFRFLDEQPEVVTRRRGRSLPYGQGVMFWALGEVVKAETGILESDGPEVVREKLHQSVGALIANTSEREWIMGMLAPLTGAPSDEAVSGGRSETFAAWRLFLEGIAAAHPLVMVIEDLHWADPAMLQFIDYLAEFSSGLPILALCTARPELFERQPGWGGGKRNVTTISLSRLTEEETARLLAHLLTRAVLPDEVRSSLLEQAGGNPLYAEEFVRMLSDRGLLEQGEELGASIQQIKPPETVQALIAARLDTLSPERKALLHDASVLGKVFWDGALSFMGGLERKDVQQGLHELSRKELIRLSRNSSMKDQAEYGFWHAVVRDVAYAEMPRMPRAEKHLSAAQWIELVAGERLADRAEILAYHYGQAIELFRASGADEKARELKEVSLRFLIMAGDQALQLDAAKAEPFYRAALAKAGPGHPQRASFLVKCGDSAGVVGRFGQAERLLEEAIAEFESQHASADAAEARVRLADVLRELGRIDDGRELLRQAVSSLEGVAPGPGLARALVAMARNHLLSDQPEESLRWCTKALHVCRKLRIQSGVARVLQFVGMARRELGDLGGLDDLQESLRMCLDLGLDSFVTATAYNNLADQLCRIEDLLKGIQTYKEGIEFTERRGLLSQAMFMKGGYALWRTELGQWDEALRTLDEELQWEGKTPHMLVGALSTKARIAVMRGRLPEAGPLKDRFLPLARQINEADYLALALVAAALIDQSEGRRTESIALIQEYAEATRSSPTARLLLQAFTDALRILAGVGDLALADALLKEEEARAAGTRATNSIFTGKAILAEARGEFLEATAYSMEAAKRWEAFGHVQERGQALLAAGRCLIALSRGNQAQEPLRQAGIVFLGLGADPALAEVDALLERVK